jgi:serine/threonine protein kinase
MTAIPGKGLADEEHIDVVLAEYFGCIDAGDELTPEQLIAAHPSLHGPLREFFAAAELVAELAGPTRHDVAHSANQATVASVIAETISNSASPEADLQFVPGRVLGRYEIERALGRGGMGTVYLAYDSQLDRHVALKIPQPASDNYQESRARFLREGRAAATLQSPHICTVYDVGEIDGQLFLSMEYIEGESLARALRQGQRFSPDDAARIVLKVAVGLQQAHARGIVHRDVKPGNIMISASGEPILMDFGLARRDDTADLRLTQSGMILGSPAYMSPEQLEGHPDRVGPASDLYSLGVVLYELLTGRLPFHGTVISVIGQIAASDPPLIGELCPALSGSPLAAVCQRMMAKRPEDRYRDMTEAAEALRRCIAKEPQLSSATTVKSRGVNGRTLILGLLLAGLGIGGALALTVVTDQGTFRIESEAKDVQVVVSQDGREIKVIDTVTDSEVKLRSGKYHIRIKGDRNDVRLSRDGFSLSRWGEVVARITRVEQPPVVPTSNRPLDELIRHALVAFTFDKEAFYSRDGKQFVRDASGNGNDAHIHSASFTSQGIAGGGLVCDGGSLVAHCSAFNNRPEVTVVTWVRKHSIGNYEILNDFGPGGHTSAVSLPESRLWFGTWNRNRGDDPWLHVQTEASIVPQGEWCFVAVALRRTKGSAAVATLHVNDQSWDFPSQSVESDAEHLRLFQHLKGEVDEFAVFDSALSVAEIETIRKHGESGNPLEFKGATTQVELPAGYRAEPSVDLLSKTDVDRDVLVKPEHAKWNRDGKDLITPGQGLSYLLIPKLDSEEYRVELHANRLGEADLIALAMPVGNRHVTAAIDSWNGAKSQLQTFSGIPPEARNETTITGTLLQTGRKHVLVYSVLSSGITVHIDGRPVINWSGDYRRLAPNAIPLPKRAMAIIDAHTSYRISKIEFTPLFSSSKAPSEVRLREPAESSDPPSMSRLLTSAVFAFDFEAENYYEKQGKRFVRDISGHQNDGMLDLTEPLPEGVAGAAIRCNGGGIALPCSALNRRTQYTFTAWVRKADERNQELLKDYHTGAVSVLSLPDTRVWLGVSQHGSSGERWIRLHSPYDVMKPGKWSFVAVSYRELANGRGEATFHSNGRAWSFATQTVMTDGTSSRLFPLMHGDVDEVALFDRALSQEEIEFFRRSTDEGKPMSATH